ncbi:DUF6151 family protein [Ruegeria sp. 2012CJ41-6]|uniref:DUF6151 family protein n=1 Tax=Ruegeria spongiae TaxID=2942209 RepID=A0ABT0Q4M9_9RHOB|nr:DUF6151 family protein [Ruegeria spongiae]MCL6284760.1 DUF6151 family protein [Ruegeria spongiae]
MAGRDLAFGCACGKLRGVVRGVSPRNGARVDCYCKDCQAFARHLGADHILDENGGTAIYQTLPARLELTKGVENLACLRLTPKGTYRWYAKCCNTPLANTGGPKLRFVGTLLAGYKDGEMAQVMGAPTAVVNVGETAAAAGVKARGMKGLVMSILWRHFKAGFKARDRESPFFDAAGKPVVPPELAPRT